MILVTAKPVLAARLVPGTVPEVRPLQPLPQEGVAPNLKENIQSEHALSPAEETVLPSGTGFDVNSPGGEQRQPGNASKLESLFPDAPQDMGVLAVILLVAVGLGGLVYWRRYRRF